jgi:hypothetical protein
MYPLTPRTALRAAGLTLVAVAFAVATLTVTPQAAGADTGERISVLTRELQTDAACLPRALALSYTVADTDTSFVLRITASAPLCDPVDATAAIYAMPGNGVAWPQTLTETRTFRIASAGTYSVRFTKTCLPEQFDVVVGATPNTIAPWAQVHGPLLFPFDTNTATQHWGWPCQPVAPQTTTTTTVQATTTTVVAPPTTAAPTTTAPAAPTTTAPGTPTTLVDTPDAAEPPVTVGQPPATDVEEPKAPTVAGADAPAAQLAFTGGETSLANLGFALLLAGIVLLAMRARRTHS